MSDQTSDEPDVVCAFCDYPLSREIIPEGVYVACEQCDRYRCPSCGGELMNYSWEKVVSRHRHLPGLLWICEACHITTFSAGTLVWAPETVMTGRFVREWRSYAQSHPSENLAAVSQALCAGIDKSLNNDLHTDLFLVALHFAEKTETVMSPAGNGWCVKRGPRKVTFGLEGRLTFMHCDNDDGWNTIDETLDLDDDALPLIVDWLMSPTPEGASGDSLVDRESYS